MSNGPDKLKEIGTNWILGYAGIFLAEYYLATGDEYILPALRQYAHETAHAAFFQSQHDRREARR